MATARKGADATLLVVDAEAPIRLATAAYFRGCGWRVLEAAGSELAKRLFAHDGAINVIFSDVQMAAELDGIELAAWVRRNYPEVDVLLTSGTGKLRDIPNDVCAQASTFTKPYMCAVNAARIDDLRRKPACFAPFQASA